MFIVMDEKTRMWLVGAEYITRFLAVIGNAHNQDVLADLALTPDEAQLLMKVMGPEYGDAWMLDSLFPEMPVAFCRVEQPVLDELNLVDINPAEMALLY